MADIKLVVDNQTQIVYSDPVFFHKSQVMPGTILIDQGRLKGKVDREWVVESIISTFTGKKVGSTYNRKVNEIRRMYDTINLTSTTTGRKISRPFQRLSYSAIWKLAK